MNMEQKKSGLIIGFITEGMVPAKWMMRVNEIGGCTPPGIFWNFSYYEGNGYKEKGGYAAARTKVIEQARAQKAKWLFLIDSDVYAPKDVIPRLMAHNKDIVCGIYYMKTMPTQPVIFKEMGDGPYWDYPVEELFEIDGSGLGCTLIKMDVFDAFEKAGLPFFQENWVYQKPNGQKVRVNVGEDHWFFMKSKELGYKIWCDSSVLCDHQDFKTGAIFPGDEEVVKIRKKILEKHGATNILKAEENLFKINKDKKTIVFYNALPTQFSGDEIEKRGVGGAETAVIHMAKNLAMDYNVFVICNTVHPGLYNNVRYVHLSDTEFLKNIHTDLMVVVRNTKLLAEINFKEFFKVDQVCLWAHDFANSPAYESLEQAMPNMDKLIVVSNWHKKNLMDKFKFLKNTDFFVTRNGLDKSLFLGDVHKERFKMVYSSTPFRGLDVLLKLFPAIKSAVPEATLHIFSSMKVYGGDYPDQWENLYAQAKAMPGVVYRGTVTQKELAQELKTAAVWVYPSHYEETFCIGAIEAIQAQVPILTSNLAALPEVIPNGCAKFIDGDSNSFEYQKNFIDRAIEILKDHILWRSMGNACVEAVKENDYSWKSIAKEWAKILLGDDITQNINTPEYWDAQYKFEDDKNIAQRDDENRWNEILQRIIPDAKSILDYGCAKGEFLGYIAPKIPYELIGIDFSEYAIKVAKMLYSGMKENTGREIRFYTQLPLRHYDVITMQHVLEHIDEPVRFLRQLIEETTPKQIIIVVPLNDEWIEHPKVWTKEDVLDLANKIKEFADIEHPMEMYVRHETIRKRHDGSYVEEAVLNIKIRRE